MGGQCTKEEAEILRGKFLRISWNSRNDKILAHMLQAISPKEKRIDKDTVLYNAQDIEKLKTDTALTIRLCLTLLMTRYDPSEFLTYITLTVKPY